MSEDKNVSKPRQLWDSAVKAVKGGSTEQLVETFTSEMTLVAEGLCEDQNNLRKELAQVREMAEKLEQELRALLEDVSVKIVHDVGVVEVRSFLGDRGDILKTLLARYKEEKKVNPELVVCLGDSSVDEPMFS